jgi:hypothetical protein
VREIITSLDEEILEYHDITKSQEPPQMAISHKRKPASTRNLFKMERSMVPPKEQ